MLALPDSCLNRLHSLLAKNARVLLGIVGPPGAGKSTLAASIQAAFAQYSQIVPMDGFHLANSELTRLGLADKKGAPNTFDSVGFAHLLRRIQFQSADELIYAPEFKRDIEEPIANAIAILPTTQLIIVEGNYLLLPQGAWPQAAACLDESWYLQVDDTLRQQRLCVRHQQFGRSLEAALAWIKHTDEPNAKLIADCKARADWVCEWPCE